MAKEIRVGKTTKLIRETEKDISGLPLLMETEDTSVKNPIPEEITAPVADITETVIEDETLHEEKPAVSPDVQPPKEPLDEIEIIITETEESKEQKRKNKKNFLLLALGGLALLFVANS